MSMFAASSAFGASKGAQPDSVKISSSGGCGTVPYVAPSDPQRLLRSVPKSTRDAYIGWKDYPIQKSAWANWKPKKKSGLSIEVVWVPLSTPIDVAGLASLKKTLNASGLVKSIKVQAVNSFTDVPGQLQQYQTALSRKPDLIIAAPIAASAFGPLVTKAGQAGIPTVNVQASGVNNKYAVNVGTNIYLLEAFTASGVLKAMGGKGSILQVRGFPGIPLSATTDSAWAKVLSRCPKVKVAGSVNGQFDSTAAKTAVQQYLATHPSSLQGLWETGTMALGARSAFSQAGRTPPPIADGVATRGNLAYWHNHPKYTMSAALTPFSELGGGPGRVVVRMLKGHGVKMNQVMAKPYVISKRSQLNSLWKPSWKESSTVGVDPPRGFYLSDSYLDGLFNRK